MDTLAKHRSRSRWKGLVIVVGVLTALIGAATAVSAQAGGPPADPPGASRRIEAEEKDAALDYWTEERMRNAKASSPGVRAGGRPPAREAGKAPVEPADRGRPSHVPPTGPAPGAKDTPPDSSPTAEAQPTTETATVAAAAATTEGYWQASNTANPNRQIGRLFFQQWDHTTRTWKDYNCSGAVVNSENKSVVWTAGHCVYQTYANAWNRNYVFCPGYRSGSCPLGRWTPYSQHTTTQWQRSVCQVDLRCSYNEFNHDLGALKISPIYGHRIANWVGSHGIRFNGAVNQHRYGFGYPLNKSRGEILYYCAGNDFVYANNLYLQPCTAGGGASGGPWLSEVNASWLGYVHSVNSHGEGSMGGPYQGNVAQNLYASVRS